MAIQFKCVACHSTLSIANRKAGCIVKCPKCGTNVQVPAHSLAKVPASEDGSAAPEMPNASASPSDCFSKRQGGTSGAHAGLSATHSVNCPNSKCYALLKIPNAALGKLFRCKKCGILFPVLGPDTTHFPSSNQMAANAVPASTQHDSALRRFLRPHRARILIACLLVPIALLLRAYFGNSTTKPTNRDKTVPFASNVMPHKLPSETNDQIENFATLAELLGSPALSVPADADSEFADEAVMRRTELARQALLSPRSLAPDLAQVRSTSLQGLETCRASIERWRQLDNTLPDYESIVKESISAAGGIGRMLDKKPLTTSQQVDVLKLTVTVLGELYNEIARQDKVAAERRTYQSVYNSTRFQAVRSMRDAAVTHYKASPRASHHTLDLVFNGSWNGAFPYDWLYLRNATGHDLTYVAVFVDLIGFNAGSGNKEADAHMHYLRRWPAGSGAWFPYPSSRKKGLATSQSSDTVESVAVTFFADQCWDKIDYKYIGKHYDADVKRYFEEAVVANFTGSWNSETLFREGGFDFQHKSISWGFPVNAVTVTVTHGTQEIGLRWDLPSDYKMSGTQTFRDKRFNSLTRPTKVVVKLEFPRSSYTHEMHLDFP
jgi:hypothetical protein